jgi:hypothetical protein
MLLVVCDRDVGKIISAHRDVLVATEVVRLVVLCLGCCVYERLGKGVSPPFR